MSKSAYIQASFFKYHDKVEPKKSQSTGPLFSFENRLNFLGKTNDDVIDVARNMKSTAIESFKNGLLNLGTSFESNVDLNRIYINLNDGDSGDCINENLPLDVLKDIEISGNATKIIIPTEEIVCKDEGYCKLKVEKNGMWGCAVWDTITVCKKTVVWRDTGYAYWSKLYKDVIVLAEPSQLPASAKAIFQHPNELKIYYHTAAILSIVFRYDVGTLNAINYTYFYQNIIIISKKKRMYRENFKNLFFYSSKYQKYFLNDELQPLQIAIYDKFFPFLVANFVAGGDSAMIHGQRLDFEIFESSPDIPAIGSQKTRNDYTDLCFLGICTTPPNTMACCESTSTLLAISNVDQYTINQVTSEIQSFYYFFDGQVCPINADPKEVMAIMQLANPTGIAPTLYCDIVENKDKFNVDIYAYNFKKIELLRYDNVLFDVTGYASTQTGTVIIKDKPLPFSGYSSVKKSKAFMTLGRVDAFVYDFKSTSPGAEDAHYFLEVPVKAPPPSVRYVNSYIKPVYLESTIDIFTLNCTSIKYRSEGFDEVKKEIPCAADGLGQITLDLTCRKGLLYVDVFNYFYNFDNTFYKKSYNYPILYEPSFEIFQLIVHGGTLYNPEDSDLRNSMGQTMSDIYIAPCNQASFDNYTVYSAVSTSIYSFTFYFTFRCKDTSVKVQIGPTGKIREAKISGTVMSTALTLTLTRAELFKEANYNMGRLDILISLNGETPFKIPFTFIFYSDYLPNGLITQDLKINANLMATFSFAYQYATKIKYEILDHKNELIYGPIIEGVDYSVSLVNTTREFPLTWNGWGKSESAKARVSIINLKNVYPHEEQTKIIETSSYKNAHSKLNLTTPGVVEFYSDETRTTAITEFKKGDEPYYMFLQLYDYFNRKISIDEYGVYLKPNPKTAFTLIESNDSNTDLDKYVSITRVNDYLYYFKVTTSSAFNDLNLSVNVTFFPINE